MDTEKAYGTPLYKVAANNLIRQYGTQNEIERLEAGVLPEHEHDLIVSEVLFDTVLAEGFTVRRKVKDNAVRQIAVRRGKATWDSEVTFEIIEDADSLSAVQWETLKRLQKAAPKADVKTHWVVAVCGEYEQRQAIASVEIKLGDRVRRLDVYLGE
jgi:hypothetical protein